jgi:predicted PurR-regulated permease PerM
MAGLPLTLERRGLQRWTFLVLLALAGYLFWLIAQPIWVPLFLGMLIAMGVHPLHQRLVRRLSGREALSAALLTILVLLVALGLGAAMTVAILGQAIELARDLSDHYRHGGTAEVLGPRLQAALTALGQDPKTLRMELVSKTDAIATNIGGVASRLVSASVGGVLAVAFTGITAYYLLRQGERLTDWLVAALPLPDAQVRELVRSFGEVTRAMLLGTGATALYEAAASFVAYWIAGVPQPAVWAAISGIATVIPVVGITIIAGPIAIWLAATGHLGAGVAVMAWNVTGVSGVSNYVLRPWLLGARVRMNDLLAFIALFGGAAAFGLLGVILGPIIAALLVSLVGIYLRDYQPKAAAQPQPGAVATVRPASPAQA